MFVIFFIFFFFLYTPLSVSWAINLFRSLSLLHTLFMLSKEVGDIKTPVLDRSPKLSNNKLVQYLNG